MADCRLIINADDFGIAPGVTRGIAEAMARGVVTSASVMVNMPGWNDAAQRLRGRRTQGAFGLHLNLVAGEPLTPALSLVDRKTGRFHSLQKFLLRATRGSLNPDEVAAECSAQFARLADTGTRITHVDSHRHVHVVPIVAKALASIIGNIPLRRPREAILRTVRNGHPTTRQLLLFSASCALKTTAMTFVDHFAGLTLQGSSDFGGRLGRLIETLPDGITELMVHPGYVDDTLLAIDGYTQERERELKYLLSPDMNRRLRARGVELVDFSLPSLVAMKRGA